MRHPLLVLCLALLSTACTTPPVPSAAPLLIYGEQHDQPDQQRQVADVVQALAAQGRLAAVVIEMADAGRSTAGLPTDATEARVREALGWAGWPWEAYAGVVMNAVRAGVPVLGGNLPRPAMRDAMADASLETRIDASARERLAEAVRSGHCDLLPAAQQPGMLRIQIARDVSMARTVTTALASAAPGSQVLLLTGAVHASRDRGVPLHLPAGTPMHVTMFGATPADLQADARRPARVTPRPDPCEDLRQQLQQPASAAATTAD